VLQFSSQAVRLRCAAFLSQAGRLRLGEGGSGNFLLQETAEGGDRARPFPFSLQALSVSKTGACCESGVAEIASTVSSAGI
jgi:hypothetical protein